MIDKYKQAFQEEARELLAELESALLELDQKRDDREVVGRAFRALHTIKGSGAMFGFDDIAVFAHNLETAFDQLRNGQLEATADLINLTLGAGDQIKTMLDEADGRATVDQGRSANILAELRQLTGSADVRPEAPVPVPSTAPDVSPGGLALDWRIRFRPGLDVLLHGTNPLLLLRELRELGQLRISLDTAAIPPLGQIDAERCYLAWDMVLTTAAAKEAIRDVFIFVEDESELTVERVLKPVAETCQPETVAAKKSVPDGSGDGRGDARGAGGPATASSIRVSADKLDQLVNLVGELVTVQARLSEVAGRRDDADILDISEAVDRLTAALRENTMSIRMLPLKTTFERFRRLVHDLSVDLHKEVDLTQIGRASCRERV